MTKDQMKWAKQHDWFRDCVLVAGMYRIIVRGDSGESANQMFDSFQELRAWAGY